MEILAQAYSYGDDNDFGGATFVTIWLTLLCAHCDKVMLQEQSGLDDNPPEEFMSKILYPSEERAPRGVPDAIRTEYEAAQRIKSVNPNAYGGAIRRVLEMVCHDAGASKGTLAKRLERLASEGKIPTNLVEVAKGLRDLGNIGVHAGLGELTWQETGLIDSLCRAVLEYLYGAPFLASQAVECSKRLKKARDGKSREAAPPSK